MKRLTAILLCTLAFCTSRNPAADGWDAPADQHVNALHRLPARATSYSYETPQDALAGDRAQSRMMPLDGVWKFRFAEDAARSPEGFWQPGADLGRLGRDRGSLVLGDAGLRVSDIHQHPLSVRVQAAVDHTRQPDGMLRPKVHRTPKLGRRPGSAALRGRILGLLRLGQRHPGRICRGQLPALGIRRHPACCDRARTRSP